MTSEIQKFDPSQLMEGVRDRIKATFVSLIPDEQWEQMIAKVLTDFQKKEEYGTKRSPLENIAFKVMEEQTREILEPKIKEFLSQYVSNTWNGDKMRPNEELVKLMTENADKMFATMFASAFQYSINQMQQGGYR